MTLVADLPERWQKRITITGECWNWDNAGSRTARYGTVRHEGRVMGAHRAMHLLVLGPIAEGAVVRHTCDNTACVNPAHLILGTQSDNIFDAVARGRHRSANGEKTHCKRGHPLSGDNLYVATRSRDGGISRQCRACMSLRQRARRVRLAADAAFNRDDALRQIQGTAVA